VSLQERVHAILEEADEDSPLVWVVNGFLIAILFVDLLCFAFESGGAGELTRRIEIFVLFVFTVEYVVRLWAIGAEEGCRGLRGRLRYVVRPFALVDLLAILPIVNLLPGVALPFSHRLPAVRAFRLVKLLRYSRGTRVLLRSVWRLRRELSAFFILAGLLVVLAGLFIYEAEAEANPAAFPNVASAMWWSIVTMTTVGYGDQVPVTATGRVIGSLVMICGIGMFALPAGLLGAAFTEETRREREARRRRRQRQVNELRRERIEEGAHVVCPDCGLEFRPRSQDFG